MPRRSASSTPAAAHRTAGAAPASATFNTSSARRARARGPVRLAVAAVALAVAALGAYAAFRGDRRGYAVLAAVVVAALASRYASTAGRRSATRANVDPDVLAAMDGAGDRPDPGSHVRVVPRS